MSRDRPGLALAALLALRDQLNAIDAIQASIDARLLELPQHVLAQLLNRSEDAPPDSTLSALIGAKASAERSLRAAIEHGIACAAEPT